MKPEVPPELETGIRDIDDQHRSMFVWTSALLAMDGRRESRKLMLQAIQFLTVYAKYHFAAEEYAMVALAYPGFDAHRKEHLELRRRLALLTKQAKLGMVPITPAIQTLVKDWMATHIRRSDAALARHCAAEPSVRELRLPTPRELRESGHRIEAYERVEVVHGAGEMSVDEVKARVSRTWS